MNFQGIPISSLWTVLRIAPAFFLRKFFPPEKLASLMYVDLRPRGEPIAIDLGEVTSFDIWLNIINLSPFEVELDRASVKMLYGGVSLDGAILRRLKVQPGEIASLHVSGSLADGSANHLARTYSINSDTRGWLEADMYFNCKLHTFHKVIRGLDEIYPRLFNEKQRLPVNLT